jgi:FG-GAP-like repeat
MCPFLRSVAILAFLGAASAAAQDLRVVAELPRAGAEGEMSVQPLAASGPPFVVCVGPAVVNVWPVGRVSEPVVSVLPDASGYQRSPAFGDFDGDGLLDLAVIADGDIAVLKGDGAGRFTPAATLATNAHFVLLAAGDFDGDGRADLVAVPSYQFIDTGIFSCFLSTGGFAFAPARRTVTPCCGVSVRWITAGDVDGDGLADLVVSSGYGTVTIWNGAGDGTFTLSGQQLGWGGYYPGRVRIVDLDGDGRPDLVFENENSGIYLIPVEVYKNDGGGTFHQWAEFQMSRSAIGPFVADVDGDGRPEIVFEEFLDTWTGHSLPEPYISIWKLAGGAFTESRLALPDKHLAVVAAVDWDGDGRPEYVGAGADRLQIFGRTGARTDVVVVPVLLSTTGLLGSRFDSDLLLTNSGTTPVHATLRYTAAAGGGSGTMEQDLAPGRQLFAPSAVGYLRDAGLPIATEGNVIGTLRIEVTGASSPRALSASVRTTTPAGAGVAYGGSPLVSLLRGSSIVPWLVETARDRTNLAVVNAGAPSDGSITLRVEVHPGDGASASVVLPDVVLSPGAFSQIGRVLAAAGLTAPLGWARILRVGGNAPYLAWAAVTAGSGDGSFVPAVSEGAACYGPCVVPSAVQSGRYATEFVATNPEAQPLALQVTLVATGTVLEETLAPGATFYLPDLFAELRRRGLPGAPAADAQVVSPFYLTAGAGFTRLYAGIRVSSAPSAGTSYGVFEAATAEHNLYSDSAVVPDLRQDERTRTNLGILNLDSPMTFRIEITDGETGRLVTMRDDLRLEAHELRQLNAILNDMAPGTKRAFARVTPVSSAGNCGDCGAKLFVAYAVVNDGPEPGQGTGDGSFVPAIPE